MGSQSASPSNPLHVRTRTVFRYVARAALGAIMLYAVLGSHSDMSMQGVSQQYKALVTLKPPAQKAAATYWSMPSAPEATVTPDHVKKGNTPPSPEPEELLSSEPHAGAAASSTYGKHSYPSEGEGIKETTLDESENIEDFLKNLFEDDGVPLPDDLKAPVAHSQRSLSEEEKAEIQRLQDIETKEKRAEITNRHTQWEKKLAKAGEEELLELIEKVKVMRKTVVESMRTKPEMFNLLKSMQEDGFKQVENTNKFLQKVKKDGSNEEGVSSKWVKIVAKVQERLDARMIETATYLQRWYKDIMQKEKAVFEASADMIDKLADEAQADIGMDYAWLDDVSTDDWTRYHKLKGEAKRWIGEFESIYNATHVDMPENIVITELTQVETAMKRVVADLNQALDQIRMKGDRWLVGEPEPETTASTSPSSGATTPAGTEEAAPSPVEDAQEDTSTIPAPETSVLATTQHQEL